MNADLKSRFRSGEAPAADVRGISRDVARLRGKGSPWRRPFLIGKNAREIGNRSLRTATIGKAETK